MLAAFSFDWGLNLGDLIVGFGTLALAGVTWQLAKSGAASLEALDLPFLLAAPDPEQAFDFVSVFEDGEEEPSDAEWAFSVELTNLGAGPAIFDGISLRNDADEELVKQDWEVDWLLKPKDDAKSVGIPLKGDPPDESSRLTLDVFYRSASGNRYFTQHEIRVGKRMRAHRLKFKREKAKG